jgi:hypothetical protein
LMRWFVGCYSGFRSFRFWFCGLHMGKYAFSIVLMC